MTHPVEASNLVGRREEVVAIDRLLATLEADRAGGVLVIAGEAGVGKTRLVEALVEMASDRCLGILVGRCIQFGESLLPLAPVVDFLGELDAQLTEAEFDSVIGPAREELAGLTPGRVADLDASEALEPARLVELVQGVIARLAERAPLVLVIEDLHWADRTTRDLVGFLAITLRRHPVLLVGTYRSDDLHRRHPLLPALAELQRSARPERLDLEPFDPQTTAEFALAVAGGQIDSATVAEMQRRSGGNPFYLEELLVAAEPGASIPMTLREVVMSRAVDLDEASLSLLRVASVAGAHLDVGLLADATGLEKAAMNAALHQLVDAHLLVEEAGRFRFRHELTREVFADDLLPGERTDLHAALATTLRQTDPSRLGEIAYHWDQAGEQAEALRASVDAGEAARQAGATAEALQHFERALELWDRTETPDDAHMSHPDLLLRAGEAANHVQEFRRAVDLAHQACRELRDADNLTRALAQAQLMGWLWDSGEPGLDEAADLAFELIQSEPASAEVARILGRVGRVDLTRGRMELSLERCHAALEMARATGDRSTEAGTLDTIALHRISSHEAGAVEMLGVALDLALEIEDSHEITRAYVNLSELLFFEGRHEEAIEKAREGLRYSEEHGYRVGTGAMLAENASRCLEVLGRWEELEPLYEEVLAWRPLDLDVPAPTGLSVLERVMVKRGETDRARPLLEHDRDAALTGYYCGTLSVIIGGLLELNLIEGHEPDRQLIDSAVALVAGSHDRESIDLMTIALRCEADAATSARYTGDEAGVAAAEEAAGRWLEQVELRLARESTVTVDDEYQIFAEQCRAEHARVHGRHDAEAWASIAARLEHYQRPWPTAYAKWRTAEAALLEGSRQAENRILAERNLCQAHEIALELRAKPLLADIEDLATRARIDLGGASLDIEPIEPTPTPFDLTPRELEVIRLVAEGYSNGRIGKELFISTKTASVHVSNILRKLGATNRIEAAAIANKSGIGVSN